MIILFFIILTLLYFYFKNKFWYNIDYYLNENIFYINPKYNSKNVLHSNVLTPEFINFYKKYYFPTINLNFQIFQNFDLIYYKDTFLKGIILNTLLPITIYGKNYTTTFVDYGVVKKEERGGNIYRYLMNETSKNANRWKTDFINFKIDNKPLNSGLKYLIKSEYLLIENIKVLKPLIIKTFKGIKPKIENYEKIENHCFTLWGLIQKNHFEIKYIFFKNNDIKPLIKVLNELLLKHKIIGFDNIGNNLILSSTFQTKLSHNTYHYMLKYDKINKENFYI